MGRILSAGPPVTYDGGIEAYERNRALAVDYVPKRRTVEVTKNEFGSYVETPGHHGGWAVDLDRPTVPYERPEPGEPKKRVVYKRHTPKLWSGGTRANTDINRGSAANYPIGVGRLIGRSIAAQPANICEVRCPARAAMGPRVKPRG